VYGSKKGHSKVDRLGGIMIEAATAEVDSP
jgi:hypothetical protein